MGDVTVPEIETKRLLLRDITSLDLDELTDLIFADPEVMRYIPKREMTLFERAERAFNFHHQTWAKHNYGGWLVTDKATGKTLGDCYLGAGSESGSGEVEIGNAIARAYWGQGVSTEATRAVIRFAFEQTNFIHIVGVALPENIGSWRVLENVGFVFEMNAQLYDINVVVYAIKREQFRPGSHFFLIHMDSKVAGESFEFSGQYLSQRPKRIGRT